MKALTWHGKGDIRCERVADPGSRTIATRSSGWRPVPFAGQIFICWTASFQPCKRRRARPWNREWGGRGREGQQKIEGRGPCRRAFHDRMRRMLLLHAASIQAESGQFL